MAYISIDVDLSDIADELSNSDCVLLIKKYLKRRAFDDKERKELAALLNVGYKEPIYTNNVINDLKLQDILPNLDKKSLEEIQQFFT